MDRASSRVPESAAHRRARHERAQARTISRVLAHYQQLSDHHGSQPSGAFTQFVSQSQGPSLLDSFVSRLTVIESCIARIASTLEHILAAQRQEAAHRWRSENLSGPFVAQPAQHTPLAPVGVWTEIPDAAAPSAASSSSPADTASATAHSSSMVPTAAAPDEMDTSAMCPASTGVDIVPVAKLTLVVKSLDDMTTRQYSIKPTTVLAKLLSKYCEDTGQNRGQLIFHVSPSHGDACNISDTDTPQSLGLANMDCISVFQPQPFDLESEIANHTTSRATRP